ncbi:hypothetical protein [Natronobacterium gregoryi]|uniref:Uncharacterized protein n=2 Tax=Natronobacterium gregoryi TaxID=44930 RepID=L0AEI2_NATGS|nr:hypothetical protein [Natronobacterium gregoryi]AFZ71470.1 hypothetical protein Natgr_0209 [Natronobacterium gregoryi SP2]ELY66772.1 hypothetical protein C490_12185 [Natronobacterium gregoryi SP2]PLK19936.1 hypothetical protein CYV19_12055 [Natronobacterium gregoryi SP2]SFJ36475.1 hypothetical protein SAMN05443661_12441 [Natronobacterium gregoryi]
MFPDSPRGRLEWAVTESLIVLGIFLFWVAIAVAVTILLRLLFLPFQLIGREIFLPLAEFGPTMITGFWSVVVPLTIVTATLYVFVRAGTLLVDYYRWTAPEA